MTHDEWLATERLTSEAGDLCFAHEVMRGDYVMPEGWVEAAIYEAGVMVKLENGNWHTHVACDEYEGDFETVRDRLWEWAKHESGDI